jgi:acyl-CoA synthetase (AMP-forming)/AMP-acid ligase II/NAD(P)-dependent dehydrogenase (short-subunit alcohol dehydrogenase family)
MNQHNDKKYNENLLNGNPDEVYVLPASPVQERLWFVDELAKNPVQNVTYAIHIRGNPEVSLLEQSVNRLVQRHEILRTMFHFHERELKQVILPLLQVKITFVDISQQDGGNTLVQARQLAAEHAYKLFDISKAPLFRVVVLKLAEREFVQVLVFHHLIFDGQSLKIFLQEMNILYDALKKGKPSPLPDISLQYVDFAMWQVEQLEKGVWDSQVEYWKQELASLPGPLNLPMDYPRPDVRTFKGKRQEFRLSGELSGRFKELSNQAGVTLFMTFISMFKLLLFCYTRQKDITVGCPVANRDDKNMNMVGPIADIIVLRSAIANDSTFIRFLEQERTVVSDAFANKDVPLDQVIDIVKSDRLDSHTPVFQVLFSFEEGRLQDIFETADLNAEPFPIEFEVVYFDLALNMYYQKEDGISGSIGYNTDLFADETIKKMINTLLQLAERIAVHPHEKIKNLLVLREDEFSLPVYKELAFSQPLTIGQRFEQQVTMRQDQPVIISKNKEQTCGQLAEKSRHLSFYLQERYHIKRGDRVALLLRDPEYLAAGILGILNIGAVCVMLDGKFSTGYSKAVMEESGSRLLLVEKNIDEGNLPGIDNSKILYLDSDEYMVENVLSPDSPLHTEVNDTAFVFFDSRFRGEARGIEISHFSMLNCMDWLNEKMDLDSSSKLPYFFADEIKYALQSILLGLLFPVSLHIIDSTENSGIISRLKLTRVSHWLLSFNLFNRLYQWLKNEQENLPVVKIATDYSPDHHQAVGEIPGNLSGLNEIIYFYGYPEDTFITTSISHNSGEPAFVVGDPLPGKKLYILDDQMNPVPPGAFGELYIGGNGVSRQSGGERLIPDPFTGKGFLLKTGEIVRWNMNNRLQVNMACNRYEETIIAGQRISLSTCEHALLTDEQVRDCKVVAKKIHDKELRLVVFYSARSPLEPAELKRIIRQKVATIPDSVIFQQLQHIPLLENGQVDTRALEKIEVIGPDIIPHLESKIRESVEVDDIAVIVKDTGIEKAVLDLEDLLPGDEQTGEEIDTPGSPQAEPEELPPSIVQGGELDLKGEPLLVGDYLLRAVEKYPDKKITVIDLHHNETTHTYSDLLVSSQKVLKGLRAKSIKPQDKIILLLKNDWDFISVFWGCILGGFVPVPLSTPAVFQENEATVKKAFNILELLDDAILLTRRYERDELTRLAEKTGAVFRCEVMEEVLDHEPDADIFRPNPDDLALMMFTSGSTGMPKGVTQTHRALIYRTLMVPDYFALGPDDVSVNWMPLDHVATLVMTHMRDIFVGLTIVLVAKEIVLQNPLEWLNLIHKYRGNYTWSANFAFGLVNDCVEKLTEKPTWNLSCLRYIINAGEAVVPKTTRHFLLNLQPYGLPADAMNPSWGMSETCSTTIYENFSLETTSDQDSFTVCGESIKGMSMRITENDTDNQVVPEKTEGSLQVKGACVTKGYYKNEKANKKSYTPDGWFITGDLGYIRNGKLTITGRSNDVIIINGINYYSHEIEAVVETVDGIEVAFTAACAVRTAGDETDQVAIFFNTPFPESEMQKLFQAIRGTVRQEVGVTPKYLLPVTKETIPKTEIGKIQRSKLVKMFDNGQFEAILKKYSASARDLGNMLPFHLYRPLWRQKQANRAQKPQTDGGYLFFNDHLGLNKSISQQVQKDGRLCISVGPADTFKKNSETDYVLDYGEPAHYSMLLEQLQKDGLSFSTIVHSLNYCESHEVYQDANAIRSVLQRGFYSLMYLVQALLKYLPGQEIHLFVITGSLYKIVSTDVSDPAKAALTGLLKTIPLEIPQFHCRHIDLSMSDMEIDTANVIKEMKLLKSEEQVAYRGKKRFVFRLKAIDFPTMQTGESPLKEEGLYLVTGGLGGIGKELALYLLEKYRAKLLIIGRTALPEPHLWEKEAAENGPAAAAINHYRELLQIGKENVIYRSISVVDQEALAKAVTEAKNRWQSQLFGIFHLAGAYSETFIADDTRENVEALLEAKIYGTNALYHLLEEENREGLFVAFSSLYAVTGGTWVSAYAAANSFLDSMTAHMKRATGIHAYCFNWSMWSDIGMSKHSKIITQFPDLIKGSEFINPEQGFKIMEIVMRYNLEQCLIGLNHENRFLWRYLENVPGKANNVVIYFTSETIDRLDDKLKQSLTDHFNLFKIPLEDRRLEEIPRTGSGEIDTRRLKMPDTDGGARFQYKPPETTTQKEVAAIWSDLLDMQQVGIDDKFFEIGGDSVRITRMVGILKQRYEVDINVVNLFKNNTIRLMSAFLEKIVPELKEEAGVKGIEL